MGRPLINWDEEKIYKALKVIDGLHKYEGNKIEKANKLPQLIKQSIIDRNYNISTILLDNMDGTIFDGDYRIHRDPHIKNWVIDQDDNLMLIDWEAALIGNKDLCRANFIFGLVDQGFPDFVKIVNNEITNFNVAKQLLVIKTLSSMSWAYWNDGFETPERQLFIGLKSILMLNER